MSITGVICACISGISQPILALISGRVTNALLVYPPTSREFRKKAYENVYIFLGVGVFVLIAHFIQVHNHAHISHNYILSVHVFPSSLYQNDRQDSSQLR